jgi:hypothetical protein
LSCSAEALQPSLESSLLGLLVEVLSAPLRVSLAFIRLFIVLAVFARGGILLLHLLYSHPRLLDGIDFR